MNQKIDYKKEWETVKKQFNKFSQEASVVIKKWEEEFIKISKKGKLHIDTAAFNLKKEHLYYLIGKEYMNTKNHAKPTLALKKLVNAFKKVDESQRRLMRKLTEGKISGDDL